jgi:hypothetical protein
MKISNFFHVTVTEYNEGHAIMLNHHTGRRVEMVHVYGPEEWELRIIWENSTKEKVVYKNMEDAVETAFKLVGKQ